MTANCVLEPCLPEVGAQSPRPEDVDLATSRFDDVPCRVADPDLWFADDPRDLERAKSMCIDCPLRAECLRAALDRAEPWGVWGGEILDRGVVIARKRPRGRPRKNAA